MGNDRVVVFGYGDLCTAAIAALTKAGADVATLVLPSNRSGPDVDRAREFAAERSIPLLVQPPRKAAESFAAQLRHLNPDLILVWSYSMILPQIMLDLPRLGAVNLHGGLLPEYRGGHVMQWAIINGERETGMTLHYLDAGIDTGPVIDEERFPIEWTDDAASVRDKLKAAGLKLIERWYPALAAGQAPRVAQDESKARYYRLRTADDGLVNWSASAVDVYNLVRALVNPWPGAFTFWRGRKLIIWRVELVKASAAADIAPGTVCGIEDGCLRVRTGEGDVLVREAELDADGKTIDPAAAIMAGERFSMGLTESGG